MTNEEMKKLILTIEKLTEEVRQLNEFLKQENEKQRRKKKNISNDIKQLLFTMGIMPNLKGFDYLCMAIEIRMKDPKALLTKEIYPQIAKKFGVVPSNIDRGIRTAIKNAIQRMDEETKLKIWKNSSIKELTNNEFISLVAEFLQN